MFIAPSVWRRTPKDSDPIVVMGVDRGGVRRDSGALLAKDDSANFARDGYSYARESMRGFDDGNLRPPCGFTRV